MTDHYITYSTFRPIQFNKRHFANVRRKRILSFFIDLAIFSFAYSLIYMALYVINKDAFDINNLVSSYVVFWILYHIFHLSSARGMTFGMRYTKLRLMQVSGKEPNQISTIALPIISLIIYVGLIFAPVDFWSYFLNKSKHINALTFYSAVLIWIPFFNVRKRALQDFICRVVFIRSDV